MSVLVSDPDLVIHVGDALEVLRGLPDVSVDAVVTSPPYADARDDYTHVGPHEYAAWLAPIAAELLRVVTPTGGFMLNLGRIFRGGEESPYVDEAVAVCRSVGWKRIDTVVWFKTNGMPYSGPYLSGNHEHAFWFGRETSAYRGYDSDTRRPHAATTVSRYSRSFITDRKGGKRDSVTRGSLHPDGARPMSVYVGAVGQGKGNPHPAPMDEGFCSYLVALSCPRGGTVLDPFGGSGTTGLVARRHGRRAVLIELNADYARLAAERCQQLSLLAHDGVA